MKFVIRSLLFVNLLLQMTNSLRQCFNHDQNIMITIILLAFSVIGLIGLVIGNRFILIIFSASMTLILIASITIYAIGKTEEESLKPKVPYFTSRNANQATTSPGQTRPSGAAKGGHRLNSLVDKWLTNELEPKVGRDETGRTRGQYRAPKSNRNGANSTQFQRQRQTKQQPNNRGATWRDQRGRTESSLQPSLTDELSDEPQAIRSEPDRTDTRLDSVLMPGARIDSAGLPAIREAEKKLAQDQTARRIPWPVESSSVGPSQENTDDDDDFAPAEDKVRDEQWVAYESYLHEQYSNMVSQSIDLVMHTILAAWMALLLDDDSDKCFGSKTASPSGTRRDGSKALPAYDYNGVRYSIRPDMDDSLAHIVIN